MPAVGGPIESISVRGRIFAVASDADANMKLGGFENEVQPNGNRTARLIKKAVNWMLDGVQVQINQNQADLEFLQEIADGLEFEAVTITMASGVTYQGNGQLVDEFAASSQSATATVKFEGEGKLTQQ